MTICLNRPCVKMSVNFAILQGMHWNNGIPKQNVDLFLDLANLDEMKKNTVIREGQVKSRAYISI